MLMVLTWRKETEKKWTVKHPFFHRVRKCELGSSERHVSFRIHNLGMIFAFLS